MSLDTVEKLTGDLQITSSRLSIQPMNFCNGSIQTYMQSMVREMCRRSSWLQASGRKGCRRLSIVEYPI